jgi:hypothetical protein
VGSVSGGTFTVSGVEEMSVLRVPSLDFELGSMGERQRSTETSTSRIKPPRRASSIRGGAELEERPDIGLTGI